MSSEAFLPCPACAARGLLDGAPCAVCGGVGCLSMGEWLAEVEEEEDGAPSP